MFILKDKKIEEYQNDLRTNEGKVSFEKGETLDIDSQVKYIVPGFVDQHIHGAAGVDTMDGDFEKIHTLQRALVKEGTTSFLPTTMTYDIDVVKKAIEQVKVAKDENIEDGAKIQGVHLEGPFISEKHIGAQNPNYVLKPSVSTLEMLNESKLIKLVTIAVEEDENFELVKYCKANGIVASVGHSDASCTVVNEAIKNGLGNFTHLYNAMKGMHHREPGAVTSALLNREVVAEMIVDGIHLHPEAVRVIYENKGSENVALVTDAMRAKACEDGEYDLGGQTVYKKGMEARLASGALAGSVLLMNQAVKNYYEFTKCKLEEAFNSASYVSANNLGLKNVGVLSEGYDCDVTMLDEDFNVVQTFINGKEVYRR